MANKKGGRPVFDEEEAIRYGQLLEYLARKKGRRARSPASRPSPGRGTLNADGRNKRTARSSHKRSI